MQANSDDLLWRHLKTVPAFRALLRSIEARLFQQIQIDTPSLDLGCGDGHFAHLGLNAKITIGIDPWWGPLNKAKRTTVYDHLIQGLGDRLPFPENYFQSIISNSVLEHIQTLQPVLSEVYRVLRDDGIFVFTTPSDQFTKKLGGAQWFEKHGLHTAADWYRGLFNAISRHHHTEDPDKWMRRLEAVGFSVDHWQYYFSAEALHALEYGHLQGIPSAIIHALTGHWIVAPWKSSLKTTEDWVRPLYEEPALDEGTMLFFVARK